METIRVEHSNGVEVIRITKPANGLKFPKEFERESSDRSELDQLSTFHPEKVSVGAALD